MGLEENFFAIPPDLPSLEYQELRRAYEIGPSEPDDDAGDAPEDEMSSPWRFSSTVIELDVDLRIPTVRVLLRLPLPEEGDRRHGFLGSLTIPLAECSWVVKVLAVEGHTTGLRESTAFVTANKEGAKNGQSHDEIMATFNPYDRRWDTIVPGDPLSAVRDHLDRLQTSLQCRPEFYDQTPFAK